MNNIELCEAPEVGSKKVSNYLQINRRLFTNDEHITVLIMTDDYMHDNMEHELSFFFDNSNVKTFQNNDKK